MTIREYLEAIRDRHEGATEKSRFSLEREHWSYADAVAALKALDEAEVERSWEYPHRVEFRLIPDPESSEIAENEA